MGVHTIAREEAATKTITRRRELPRGRAVIGGFLVALAAVGVFGAYRRAEAPPSTHFAVLADDVAPGERLEADDLALVALDLPPAQAATAYTDPTDVVGAITTHALPAGAVLRGGDVRESTGYIAAEELAFEMPAAQALGNSLQAGERVDVVATYGTGAEAFTTTVVSDALVISAGLADGLAGSDSLEIRLGFSESAQALAVAHAVTQGEIFLIRSPDSQTSGAVYSPPGMKDEVQPPAVTEADGTATRQRAGTSS